MPPRHRSIPQRRRSRPLRRRDCPPCSTGCFLMPAARPKTCCSPCTAPAAHSSPPQPAHTGAHTMPTALSAAPPACALSTFPSMCLPSPRCARQPVPPTHSPTHRPPEPALLVPHPTCRTVLGVLPRMTLQLPDEPPSLLHAISCLVEAVAVAVAAPQPADQAADSAERRQQRGAGAAPQPADTPLPPGAAVLIRLTVYAAGERAACPTGCPAACPSGCPAGWLLLAGWQLCSATSSFLHRARQAACFPCRSFQSITSVGL